MRRSSTGSAPGQYEFPKVVKCCSIDSRHLRRLSKDVVSESTTIRTKPRRELWPEWPDQNAGPSSSRLRSSISGDRARATILKCD
jgi:hypothetical protein